VPFVMSGPSRYGGTAEQRQVIYDHLRGLEAADVASGVFDARMNTEISGGVFVYPEDYAFDGLHFSALGQVKKARGYFDTWKLVLERIAAPAAAASPPSPTEIVARIDAAILNGLEVVSFPGNGGQIVLRGLDEMMRAREQYAILIQRKSGVRRTLARFN